MIHTSDLILLHLCQALHNSAITDQPIYLTHTSLNGSGDDTALQAYRFVLMQITELISIGFICDPGLDTNNLYDFLTSQLD